MKFLSTLERFFQKQVRKKQDDRKRYMAALDYSTIYILVGPIYSSYIWSTKQKCKIPFSGKIHIDVIVDKISWRQPYEKQVEKTAVPFHQQEE